MECKTKSKQDCISSPNCVWVNATKPYCRKRRRISTPYPYVELENMTVSQLKTHPLYKQIIGRSRMRKKELIEAIKRLIVWKDKCKTLEEKCPMPTTLIGDEWCELNQQQVIHTRDYKMCFEYKELINIIHSGFIAVDTSYEVAPLRLKLPRDPFRRELIPKAIIKKILLNKKAFKKHKKELIKYPEVVSFLIRLDDFYKKFDKPYINADPIKTSRDLEKWLLVRGGRLSPELEFIRTSNNTIEWIFKIGKIDDIALENDTIHNISFISWA